MSEQIKTLLNENDKVTSENKALKDLVETLQKSFDLLRLQFVEQKGMSEQFAEEINYQKAEIKRLSEHNLNQSSQIGNLADQVTEEINKSVYEFQNQANKFKTLSDNSATK